MSSIIAHFSFRHRQRRSSRKDPRSQLRSGLDSLWGDDNITHPLGPAFLGLYKSLPADVHVPRDSLLDLSCYMPSTNNVSQPFPALAASRTVSDGPGLMTSRAARHPAETEHASPSLSSKNNLFRSRSEPQIRPPLARPYSTSMRLGSPVTIDVYPMTPDPRADDSSDIGARSSPTQSTNKQPNIERASPENVVNGQAAYASASPRHPKYKIFATNDEICTDDDLGHMSQRATTNATSRSLSRTRLRPKVPLVILPPSGQNITGCIRTNGPLSASLLADQKSPARSIKSVRFDIPSPSQKSFSISDAGSIQAHDGPEDDHEIYEDSTKSQVVEEVQEIDVDQLSPSSKTYATSPYEDTTSSHLPSPRYTKPLGKKAKPPGLAVTEMMRSQSPVADVTGKKALSLSRSSLGLNRAIYGPVDGGPRSAKSFDSSKSEYFTPVSARFPTEVTEDTLSTNDADDHGDVSIKRLSYTLLDFQMRAGTAYHATLQQGHYEHMKESYLSSLVNPVGFF